jgi:hypothetical protein
VPARRPELPTEDEESMKTILHVETYPSSPDRTDEYNKWYDEVHVPQVLALDGFASARRYAPLADGDPHITVFELSGDPQAAIAAVTKAGVEGTLTMSDAMQLDPRPRMRLMRLITER